MRYNEIVETIDIPDTESYETDDMVGTLFVIMAGLLPANWTEYEPEDDDYGLGNYWKAYETLNYSSFDEAEDEGGATIAFEGGASIDFDLDPPRIIIVVDGAQSDLTGFMTTAFGKFFNAGKAKGFAGDLVITDNRNPQGWLHIAKKLGVKLSNQNDFGGKASSGTVWEPNE